MRNDDDVMDGLSRHNPDPWIPPALDDGRLGVMEVGGRRTGRRYRLPLGFARDSDGSLVVGSAHPASQWQWNLAAAGECRFAIFGESAGYRASELTGADREAGIALLVERYAENAPHHRVFRLVPVDG